MSQFKKDIIYPGYEFTRGEMELDQKFDDCLMISYQNINESTIKILYDESVDRDELLKEIPVNWKKWEKAGKLKINLELFTTDSVEYRRSVYITEVILKDEREELIRKLNKLKARIKSSKSNNNQI
uniref:Uncharacterized protein n=1 Tax=Pithovirus LCPAC202 TaxID=2506592 RepID=A0A481Z616_9VIRU|nr:MAG: hypothetical protein LCPAC202_02720 [Pithovirus LCPAC202]